MLLDAQPDIDVVGAAADGREAVRLARRLRPDVGLFDIRMPLFDGIEATRALAGPQVSDPLPIVIITTFDLDEYVHGALKAGARGFLLKDAGPALLTQAIHAAADGDALIAPSVTGRLLAAFAHAQASPARQPMEPLTAREEEVLVPVARGRTNNEIAGELYITPSTVKAHLASLMRKLGARNRVEVAMWAHGPAASDAAQAPAAVFRKPHNVARRRVPLGGTLRGLTGCERTSSRLRDGTTSYRASLATVSCSRRCTGHSSA